MRRPRMKSTLLAISISLSLVAVAHTIRLSTTVDDRIAMAVDRALRAREQAIVRAIAPRVDAIYDDFEVKRRSKEPTTLTELLDRLFALIEEVSGPSVD